MSSISRRVWLLSGTIAMLLPPVWVTARQVDEPIGLAGFCPVCIIEMRQWIKGSAEHQLQYDGQTYFFLSEQQMDTFQADPVQFVPALGGDCVVSAAQTKRRVAGSVRHAALYNDRVFLFPDRAKKDEFLDNPNTFVKVDLALEGNCPVSLRDRGEKVAGDPRFTILVQGLRYQFPGEQQFKTFASNPSKYKIQSTEPDRTRLATRQSEPAREVSNDAPDAPIRISGTSKCAGCDYGVQPIRSPNTLGLAVVGAQGKIYVIEDAHELYPDVHDRRFADLRLEVTGHVLKQQDQFIWLAPVSVVEQE